MLVRRLKRACGPSLASESLVGAGLVLARASVRALGPSFSKSVGLVEIVTFVAVEPPLSSVGLLTRNASVWSPGRPTRAVAGTKVALGVGSLLYQSWDADVLSRSLRCILERVWIGRASPRCLAVGVALRGLLGLSCVAARAWFALVTMNIAIGPFGGGSAARWDSFRAASPICHSGRT